MSKSHLLAEGLFCFQQSYLYTIERVEGKHLKNSAINSDNILSAVSISRKIKALAGFFRSRMRAYVYFPAIFKWAKSEGQEKAFLLKKWRKNGKKNAQNIECSAGCLGLSHNR